MCDIYPDQFTVCDIVLSLFNTQKETKRKTIKKEKKMDSDNEIEQDKKETKKQIPTKPTMKLDSDSEEPEESEPTKEEPDESKENEENEEEEDEPEKEESESKKHKEESEPEKEESGSKKKKQYGKAYGFSAAQLMWRLKESNKEHPFEMEWNVKPVVAWNDLVVLLRVAGGSSSLSDTMLYFKVIPIRKTTWLKYITVHWKLFIQLPDKKNSFQEISSNGCGGVRTATVAQLLSWAAASSGEIKFRVRVDRVTCEPNTDWTGPVSTTSTVSGSSASSSSSSSSASRQAIDQNKKRKI